MIMFAERFFIKKNIIHIMKEDITLVEQTQRDILKYISMNGNAAARLPKEQEFVGFRKSKNSWNSLG